MTARRGHATAVAALGLAAMAACQPADSSLGVASVGVDSITAATGLDDGAQTGDASSDDAVAFDVPPADDDGFKLDVAAAFDVGSACPDPPCACGAVDLLFVVDNSEGTAEVHTALAQAFPDLLEALAPTVGEATSLHVGVTSTSMGSSLTRNGDGCAATGDRGAPADAFYETPLAADNGLLAAQGRLNLAMGMPFFALPSGTTAATAALHAWFAEAVALPAGSQIEMAGAAAAWATDPANDGVNLGFVRDDAPLLVIFVVTEPDQTPPPVVDDLVARLETAKLACGGMACVVGGGWVPPGCPDSGLATLMDAFGGRHIVELKQPASLVSMGAPLGRALEPLLRQACGGVR